MFIMQKRKLLLLTCGLLLTSCVQHENTYTETQETLEHFDFQNTVQNSTPSITETTLVSKTNETDIDCFSSANSNLKLVDLIVNEPVYDIIIENSEKSYDETINGQYPNIIIDSQNEFANVTWWPDQNQIHLQLWNINNEPEATFYLDESKCQITFPKLDFEEKSINKKISSSENVFLIESMDIYNNYISLNIQQKEGNNKKVSSEFSIRIDDKDYTPCKVDFNDATGKITILYSIENCNLKSSAQIEGILYNNNQIVTLE